MKVRVRLASAAALLTDNFRNRLLKEKKRVNKETKKRERQKEKGGRRGGKYAGEKGEGG